jgi:molybdopterin molybdotransferase
MGELERKRWGPDEAIAALGQRLATVGSERIPPRAGRVLAEPLAADRDSPAADFSAMDGYAMRVADLSRTDELIVAGEVQAGDPPSTLPAGAVFRIFTGAVIPSGAEAVVRREDTIETSDRVRWADAARTLAVGANVRRRGENGRAGATILESGTRLTLASVAAAANFGAAQISCYRPVEVSVIVTGNELLGVEESPRPWQLRDSNGPTVASLLDGRPWLRLVRLSRCGDDVAALEAQFAQALADSDAVILTGGVSKGDYDHVPGVIARAGCEVVFHRLPIRPGQPVLGAVGPRGRLILGLPGNPVSTACCLIRIGLPLLSKLSGQRIWQTRPIASEIAEPDGKGLPLHWMRLVRRVESPDRNATERVELIPGRGSGDLVALAHSDGFIEQPPDQTGAGPWPFYAW